MERKIHFSENNIILRIVIILREAKLFLGFGEQRQNTFRELRIIFKGFGENNALLLGAREHRLPWGNSLVSFFSFAFIWICFNLVVFLLPFGCYVLCLFLAVSFSWSLVCKFLAHTHFFLWRVGPEN